MRQDGYMKGREEFLASTITSAVGGVGGGLSSDGGSRGVSSHVPRVQVCFHCRVKLSQSTGFCNCF